MEEVLPAHEYRFSDLRGRLDEIILHHAERLADIERLLAKNPGMTAWDMAVNLTWSRPWEQIPEFMQRAAVGETLAHLVLLQIHQRVRTEGDRPARFYIESPREA